MYEHSSKINTRPLVECNAALIKICCFCVPQKGDAILVTAMNASGVWKGMVKGCDRVGTFKFGKVQPLVHESNGLEKNCAQNAKHRPKSLLQLLRTIGMEARICLSFVFRPFGSVPPYCFYFVSGYFFFFFFFFFYFFFFFLCFYFFFSPFSFFFFILKLKKIKYILCQRKRKYKLEKTNLWVLY